MERCDCVNDSLSLIQESEGLTFGTDALLLAGYVNGKYKNGCEFGSGSGIISMLLTTRGKAEKCTAIEVQEEYARLEQRLAGELAAEEQKNNIALRDSINNFMKEYNAIHGYDIVLSRMGENILFAKESLDITKEIIEGLNSRYNEVED